MVPTHFTSIEFFQKKKDITLYRAADETQRYILKSIITKDTSVRQAFYDEYETLSALRHPSIPVYYWLREDYQVPGQKSGTLTLCMEDCSQPAPVFLFSIGELCRILYKTTDILSYLLENGVLYTDLNPSNLIISEAHGDYAVTLVDYTYCYYFLRNPYPAYPLRFSYNISPQLKGQQFLIQALTFLLYDLVEENHIEQLPSPVYQLLETGRNPSEELSLHDFQEMLRHCGAQQRK